MTFCCTEAMDLIHRLGQHRPVQAIKLVVEDSIESRIVQLQEKKSAMVDATLSTDSGAMGRLTPEDVRIAFHSGLGCSLTRLRTSSLVSCSEYAYVFPESHEADHLFVNSSDYAKLVDRRAPTIPVSSQGSSGHHLKLACVASLYSDYRCYLRNMPPFPHNTRNSYPGACTPSSCTQYAHGALYSCCNNSVRCCKVWIHAIYCGPHSIHRSPCGGLFEKPSKIFVDNKCDAGSRQNTHEVGPKASIKSSVTLA